MLTKSYLEKLKKRSPSELETFTLRKKADNKFALRLMTPINERDIRAMTDENMNEFMEDISKNKRINRILYQTNAEKEIAYMQNSFGKIKRMIRMKDNPTHKKAKSKTLSVTQRNMAFEEYSKAKIKLNQLKTDQKEQEKKNIKTIADFYKKYKKEFIAEKNELDKKQMEEKAQQFTRSYNTVKEKLEVIQPSHYYTKTEYTLDSNCTLGTMKSNHLILPNCKLNMNDVYSRLYHNEVLHIPMKFNENIKCHKYPKTPSHNNKNKIFAVKNVFKGTQGKEFSVKVSKEMLNKCFIKYSGGANATKLLNDLKESFNAPIGKRNFSKLLNYCDEKGNTFLHIATLEEIPVVVQHLVDKGAFINKQNKDGNTPLHIAIQKGNVEIINILLDNGASNIIYNNERKFPYDYASYEIKVKCHLDKYFLLVQSSKARLLNKGK